MMEILFTATTAHSKPILNSDDETPSLKKYFEMSDSGKKEEPQPVKVKDPYGAKKFLSGGIGGMCLVAVCQDSCQLFIEHL